MTQYFHPIESGAEKTVRELSEELVKKGHKVDVVTVNKDNNLERVELKDGYRIIRLDRISLIPKFFGPIKIVNVMIQDLCYIIKMFSIIKKNKYDILICSGTETFTLASIFMKKILGMPVLVLWIGSTFNLKKLLMEGDFSTSKRIYWRYKIFISKLSVINANRILLKGFKGDFLRYYKLENEKVIPIRNPIKIPEYTNPVEVTIPGVDKDLITGRFIILFANRLTYIKGVGLLPDIVRTLKKSMSDFLLIICGSGKLSDEVSAELLSNEFKETIHFLGFRKDIDQLIRISDVCIRTDRVEIAYGKSIIESMAAGKPVIGIGTKAMREEFKHLENFYFVDERSPENYANAIIYLKNNKKIRKIIGENARQVVLQNWNMEKFADQLINLITNKFL